MTNITQLTKLDPGTGYVFSLLNGSEFIATVAEETSDFFVLEKALQFTAQPKRNEQGDQIGMSIGFTLAAHFSEESFSGQTIRVPKSAIALIYLPNEQINDMFVKQTGSLVLPR